MKARFLVVLLSFFMASVTAQAATPLSTAPIVKPASINLNTADVKTLSKSMKGIGPKRAQSIVKYREAHQGFKSVTELAEVPGIGKKFVAQHQTEIEKTFSIK